MRQVEAQGEVRFRALLDRHGSAHQLLGLGRLSLLEHDHAQLVEGACQVRVTRAERAFPDRQRTLVAAARFGQVAEPQVRVAGLVEQASHDDVVRAVGARQQLERRLEERQRVGVAAHADVDRGEVAEDRTMLANRGVRLALEQLRGAQVERLGLIQPALLHDTVRLTADGEGEGALLQGIGLAQQLTGAFVQRLRLAEHAHLDMRRREAQQRLRQRRVVLSAQLLLLAKQLLLEVADRGAVLASCGQCSRLVVAGP